MKKLNAVFVHSHIFIYDSNDQVFSEGKLVYETWQRYLKHFESLTVLGRYKEGSGENLNCSSGTGVKHVKLPNFSTIRGRTQKKNQAKSIMSEHIKTADIVIARLPSEQGLLAINISKKFNIPFVVELVGDIRSSYWYHGSLAGKILAPLSYIKVKNAVADAQYILYVTERHLQRLYPPKNAVFTTACSNVEIPASPDYYNEKSVKVTRDTFNIGLIGSYNSKYKGIENALNVIKLLNKENKQVHLKILGSGDKSGLLKKIEKLGLEDSVTLSGSLPGGKPVLEWLSSLDLYIQPSLTEGLPRALIEAMYSGLPCIASNVGGIPELLDREFLHKPQDESRLYSKIKEFYYSEDLRKNQGLNNYNKSLGYKKNILDEKRFEFWKAVVNNIRG